MYYRDGDNVLQTIVSHWLTKLECARKYKKEVWEHDADECMSFFNGPKDWDSLMGGPRGIAATEDIPDPMFKMSVNKTFEYVSIFGPSLYYENPVRTVKPRLPMVVGPQFFPDYMEYQAIVMEESARIEVDSIRAQVLERYLNWTPVENDLAGEARMAIDQALITGRGCIWTELKTVPGGDLRVVCSSFDSTHNLLVDPDAARFADAKWIARKCIRPVWQVEAEHGLPHGTLHANMESQAVQSDVSADEEKVYDRKRGLTNDLLCYYEVWSKMGLGGRLQGVPDKYRPPLEVFGDYCYLVLAKDTPFPLNLPPDIQSKPLFGDDEPNEIFDRVAWPTPYWGMGDWPVSILDFFPVADSTWSMPPLKAGMGELKFLNWVMSFLAGHLRNATRDFVAIAKEAEDKLKQTILHGKDLSLLEIEADGGKSIQDIVSFLQHPSVNGDIWKMIEAVENNFDKRTGLTELMYGEAGPTQIRSAQEAATRSQNMNVRPDDMRRKVEAWMALVGSKEAVCARYHLFGDDVKPVMGPLASKIWDGYVATEDVVEATRQLEYRIEAGSTRRPNKDAEVQQMNQVSQTLLPVLENNMNATGDPTAINNFLADWTKSRDLDPTRYMLKPVMVAPAQPGAAPSETEPGPGGPTPGEQPPFQQGP